MKNKVGLEYDPEQDCFRIESGFEASDNIFMSMEKFVPR